MNFIRQNKTTILIIAMVGIFYYLNKKIIDQNLKNIYKKILNNYEEFDSCKDDKNPKNNIININPGKQTAPTFYYDSQKDFGYHSENLKTSEAEHLYEFLQSMVTANHNMYDLTSSSTKMYRSDQKGEELVKAFLQQKLGKKVKNIELVDKIHYFKNQVCLEIKPFQIQGDYILDGENLGKVKIQLELTFRFDQPNDIFMGNMTFNRYNGIFKINRVILINHKTKKELNTKEKKTLPVQLRKPLTYNDSPEDINNKAPFDFTYDTNNLDTINSLIPEEIEVTEYEEESVSERKVRL